MRLDLNGVIPRKLNPVERRRIRDGKRALRLSEPKTIRGAKRQIEIVLDGARALQSLDDLGTLDANVRVCNAMNWLIEKAGRLQKRLDQQIIKG